MYFKKSYDSMHIGGSIFTIFGMTYQYHKIPAQTLKEAEMTFQDIYHFHFYIFASRRCPI